MTTIRVPRGAAPEWAETIRDLGVGFGATVLVVGDRADLVADAYQAAGAPPVGYARPDLAVLARTPPDIDYDGSRPASLALDSATVDLAVLRHAWTGPAGLAVVVAEAKRVLVPGGTLVLCEPDLVRLLRSPFQRYPSQLFYRLHPKVAAELGRSLVSPGELAAEAVRAGFTALAGIDVEETIGTCDRADYPAFLAERGWRGFALLTVDEVDGVIEAVTAQLPKLAPIGPVVDREPWRVLRGTRPA